MRSIRLAIICFVLPIFAATGFSDPVSRFIDGNRAYKDGNYVSAIEAYNNAIRQGANDHRVYYNLGNAHYRNGNIGEAVLAYERALVLAPRDPNIAANLEFVKVTSVDILMETAENNKRVNSIYENTMLGMFYGFLGKIALRELIFIIIVLSIIGSILLVLWIFIRGGSRRWLFGLAIAAWALLILAFVPYILKKTHIWETDKAIIVEPKAEIRSGPSQNSQLVYTYHEGMEVAVKETRGEYSRVLLRNGEEGWLKSDSIEKVIPD